MSSIAYTLSDGAVIAKRNLIKIKRVPEILIWTLMSPIMFVVLFAYVFGSNIGVVLEGVTYREYLMGGIFAQTVIFGSTFTGAGLAEDMTKGIIDRFRSLPISPTSVLVGRTGSDIFYNAASITVMAITGLLVGWRIRNGLIDAVVGFALLFLFSYAISWIMAYVGLKVSSVEVVNNASFMFIMPATFISNAFVRADFLPTPFRVFAEWNPVSSLAQAVRQSFGNLGDLPTPNVWALEHAHLYTLIWVAGILLVFVPLATRQYKKAALR